MAKKSVKTPYAQVRRIIALFRILCRSRAPKTMEQIIEKLGEYDLEQNVDTGITERTISRDIKFIREEMKYRIDYKQGQGYVMESRSDGSNELLPLFFEPHEMQAMVMGRELYTPFNGTHLADSIESVYDKIAKCFTGSSGSTKSLIEHEEAFLIQTRPTRRYKHKKEIIKTLIDCILTKTMAEISYGYFKGDPFTILVKPHKLVIYNDTFYLLAIPETSKHKEFRSYLTERIKSAKSTGQKFRPSSTAKIEDKLRHAWGIFMEGDPTTVRITFEERYEGYLNERIWHHSQKLRKTKKGIELEFTILFNEEIAHWILGFGKAVVDIFPKKLAKMVEDHRK